MQVDLATVCGSDRHTVAGHRSAPCPSVLGHEAVGRIVALGTGGARAVDGSDLAVGDRVVWGVTVPCGDCDRCRRELTAKCRDLRKSGHESLDSGWALSGGYAEHVVVPAAGLLARVPDAMPDAVAAPAACATATVMAVLERAGRLAGRRVLVVGAGMLGLAAVAGAVERGATTVVAVDPSPERRALATVFGATSTVASTAGLAEVDVVLELSGSAAALREAVGLLDVGGTIVLAGSVSPTDALPVDPEAVVRRHLTLTGVHNYEPRHLTEALDFLTRTAVCRPWPSLVEPPVGLDQLAEVLLGAAPAAPRASIAPSAPTVG